MPVKPDPVRRRFILILMLAGAVVLATSYFIARSAWQEPLGPSLAEVTFAVPSWRLQPTGQAGMEPAETPALRKPLCGDEAVLTILLAGIDYRGDNYLYGLADVIRIIRVDFSLPRLVVFALDRGLWVEIPGIEDHYGITHGLLNQAYFYGVPAMGYYDGPAGGAGLLAQTLKWNFDLDVDHYLVVSMAAFTRGIDEIGGIDVYLEQPVDGRPLQEGADDLGFFAAGWHHLDGKQALNLARIREKYSSLVRITNQDAVIRGIYARVTSPEILPKIPALMGILKETVLTDLTPQQINALACLARSMSAADLVFLEIPSEYYLPATIYSPEMHQEIQYFDLDFEVVRQYVRDFERGLLP